MKERITWRTVSSLVAVYAIAPKLGDGPRLQVCFTSAAFHRRDLGSACKTTHLEVILAVKNI
jgi:hypothetical protein